MKIKDWAIYALVIVFSIIFIFVGNKICEVDKVGETVEDVEIAKVIKILDNKTQNTKNTENTDALIDENLGEEYITEQQEYQEPEIGRVYFEAKLEKGEDKGKVIQAVQHTGDMFQYQQREVKVGDSILVMQDTEDLETTDYIFTGFNKIHYMVWLCLAFFAIIIIIGRLKGLNTLISLIFTCLAIFAVYLPSILKGYNIYLSTIIVGSFIIIMSLIIINGSNKKTWCAILGNLGGVAIAALLALAMNNVFEITGMVDEDYLFLKMLDNANPIDLKALVWGGIIIGALGAIMDVAMSIASALNELSEHMKDKSFIKMFKSGMNIGKDAIGTMTNTLILAYIGSSLAVVLLLMAYNRSMIHVFNLEMITVEVLQAIIGSIGILVAVPITTLIAAYFFTRKGISGTR